MIIKTADLQQITDKILPAVDQSDSSAMSEALEIEASGGTLYISVANREYYVRVKLSVGYDEEFHASVEANLFLNLISQLTTEDVELSCDSKSLHIRGNGSYKLPLIYNDGDILSLTRIEIYNPTVNMNIDSSVLHSIMKYNSKEIGKAVVANPVQKMYYVDESGAITFTTGACVNKFTLEKPVKMLLSGKIVKLFKLFSDPQVKFTLGYDALSREITQTKVCFEDSTVSLTAILQCDDTMLRSVPVTKILGRAESIYPYSVSIGKSALLQAINRLMVLTKKSSGFASRAVFRFRGDGLMLSDDSGDNTEVIQYTVGDPKLLDAEYTARFDMLDLKNTLSTCDEPYLTLRFGDAQALVITRDNIFNIIPEYSTMR